MPLAAASGLRSIFLGLFLGFASSAHAQEVVDLELVLAIDASWSMDFEEQLIQRDGYASAFRSDEVIEAIVYGGYGRVAVTFVEWAGMGSQQVVVPWTLIDSQEASFAFAEALAEGAPRHFRRTSISGAIDFAAALFEDNGFEGLRRVIDISGDGPNNQGIPVTQARDAAVARGITINGLPLMTNSPGQGLGYAIPNLDTYFAECVIGGGQAFVIPVLSWAEFPVAIRRKLVLELAGAMPGDDVDPIHALRASAEAPTLHLAQAEDDFDLSGSDCMVGEKIWERRRNIWNIP
ncbi:DUF1194 domain-containing protein [Pararhizobium haloflavum]|uniref:DUF1194 domain-containing protein n=1 Tax=Pararhizobium haloflavum TaxID=2037914 RepID=UPI001FDFE7DC|nr:DUF1194 domain-containing protein [Pararhizobium haloflavum]